VRDDDVVKVLGGAVDGAAVYEPRSEILQSGCNQGKKNIDHVIHTLGAFRPPESLVKEGNMWPVFPAIKPRGPTPRHLPENVAPPRVLEEAPLSILPAINASDPRVRLRPDALCEVLRECPHPVCTDPQLPRSRLGIPVKLPLFEVAYRPFPLLDCAIRLPGRWIEA
jgi:hypothetical protein